MKRDFLINGLIALLVSVTTIGAFLWKNDNQTIKIEHINSTPASKAIYTLDENGKTIPLDFTRSAQTVMDAVVHIKSTQTFRNSNRPQVYQGQPMPDLFKDFFGNGGQSPFFRFENKAPKRNRKSNPQVRMGTGSGVIINDQGYIVTNNHVVAEADDLEVTLHDNRTFKATIIGTDPSTDLAVIQIKGDGLPTLPLVNSDEVKVGEWVLAVGNPMGLNSTVTAGIVSAKARNINILKEQFAVESFIQTDAAINPGNSGGALVNLDGGLVGINTAIASPTGSYSGYGFAVPSNIVSKVVEDLLKYGSVQRGVLGIMIRSLDGNLAKEKDLNINTGVYVDSLFENSAAESAGIQVGDVIVDIDNKKIKTSPELQEVVARHRPGDEIKIIINRDGKEMGMKVTLKDKDGGKTIAEKEHKETLSILGAAFKTLDKKVARKLDINGGVKVEKLYAGKLRKYTDIREGFIITKVDGQKIKELDDLVDVLKKKKGGVMLEGVYEDIPGEYYYAFGM
ncbi:MAG: Do family serine endopeptidase [Saprospiraceae bacterium]